MYKNIIKPLLFSLDAETAHGLSFSMLKIARNLPFIFTLIDQKIKNRIPKNLNSTFLGLDFINPIGLAAGFDKNAELIDEWFSFGFGFVEVGTITPMAQDGNEKPRLFRLPNDHAIINRMGFNNKGMYEVKANLEKRKSSGIVGINIGKNKVTSNENAYLDYVKCFKELNKCGDYFVVNLSSPNTPGLRELQEKEPLLKIISSIQEINFGLKEQKPLLVKIAPELNSSQMEDLAEIAEKTKLNGVIATNTTISRNLKYSDSQLVEKIGMGGLSGEPLKDLSTKIISELRKTLPKDKIIIGCGGIFNGSDYQEKISAGADLAQIYTGFIYEGPAVVKNILNEKK